MTETLEIERPLLLRRRISASMAKVYAAWTRPEIMQKWLAPEPCSVAEVENDLKVGGSFRIVLKAPDGSRHILTGRYRHLDQDRRVVMTWLYTGPIGFLDGIETLLEVELNDLGRDCTEVVLTQSRIPTAEVRSAFEADWPTCFDKLERTMAETVH